MKTLKNNIRNYCFKVKELVYSMLEINQNQEKRLYRITNLFLKRKILFFSFFLIVSFTFIFFLHDISEEKKKNFISDSYFNQNQNTNITIDGSKYNTTKNQRTVIENTIRDLIVYKYISIFLTIFKIFIIILLYLYSKKKFKLENKLKSESTFITYEKRKMKNFSTKTFTDIKNSFIGGNFNNNLINSDIKIDVNQKENNEKYLIDENNAYDKIPNKENKIKSFYLNDKNENEYVKTSTFTKKITNFNFVSNRSLHETNTIPTKKKNQIDEEIDLLYNKHFLSFGDTINFFNALDIVYYSFILHYLIEINKELCPNNFDYYYLFKPITLNILISILYSLYTDVDLKNLNLGRIIAYIILVISNFPNLNEEKYFFLSLLYVLILNFLIDWKIRKFKFDLFTYKNRNADKILEYESFMEKLNVGIVFWNKNLNFEYNNNYSKIIENSKLNINQLLNRPNFKDKNNSTSKNIYDHSQENEEKQICQISEREIIEEKNLIAMKTIIKKKTLGDEKMKLYKSAFIDTNFIKKMDNNKLKNDKLNKKFTFLENNNIQEINENIDTPDFIKNNKKIESKIKTSRNISDSILKNSNIIREKIENDVSNVALINSSNRKLFINKEMRNVDKQNNIIEKYPEDINLVKENKYLRAKSIINAQSNKIERFNNREKLEYNKNYKEIILIISDLIEFNRKQFSDEFYKNFESFNQFINENYNMLNTQDHNLEKNNAFPIQKATTFLNDKPKDLQCNPLTEFNNIEYCSNSSLNKKNKKKMNSDLYMKDKNKTKSFNVLLEIEIKKFYEALYNQIPIENFIWFGNKKIIDEENKNDTIYQIYIRKNLIYQNIEFLLYDITSLVKSEELKAQNKIKNIFLKKFSHEFRNPLINISQLCENIISNCTNSLNSNNNFYSNFNTKDVNNYPFLNLITQRTNTFNNVNNNNINIGINSMNFQPIHQSNSPTFNKSSENKANYKKLTYNNCSTNSFINAKSGTFINQNSMNNYNNANPINPNDRSLNNLCNSTNQLIQYQNNPFNVNNISNINNHFANLNPLQKSSSTNNINSYRTNMQLNCTINKLSELLSKLNMNGNMTKILTNQDTKRSSSFFNNNNNLFLMNNKDDILHNIATQNENLNDVSENNLYNIEELNNLKHVKHLCNFMLFLIADFEFLSKIEIEMDDVIDQKGEELICKDNDVEKKHIKNEDLKKLNDNLFIKSNEINSDGLREEDTINNENKYSEYKEKINEFLKKDDIEVVDEDDNKSFKSNIHNYLISNKTSETSNINHLKNNNKSKINPLRNSQYIISEEEDVEDSNYSVTSECDWNSNIDIQNQIQSKIKFGEEENNYEKFKNNQNYNNIIHPSNGFSKFNCQNSKNIKNCRQESLQFFKNLNSNKPKITNKIYIRKIVSSKKIDFNGIDRKIIDSKIDKRNLSIFEFEKILNKIIKIFKTKIELAEKNLKITYDLNSEFPKTLHFDLAKTNQILFNLISNAVKFTNIGYIIIKAEYDDNHIIIKVADSGSGFKKETLEKIGSPFIKSEKSNNFYGTGIGLYLVKKYVISLEGEFIIESEVPKGSIITISFPYTKENNDKLIQLSNNKLERKISTLKTYDDFPSKVNTKTSKYLIDENEKLNLENSLINDNINDNIKNDDLIIDAIKYKDYNNGDNLTNNECFKIKNSLEDYKGILKNNYDNQNKFTLKNSKISGNKNFLNLNFNEFGFDNSISSPPRSSGNRYLHRNKVLQKISENKITKSFSKTRSLNKNKKEELDIIKFKNCKRDNKSESGNRSNFDFNLSNNFMNEITNYNINNNTQNFSASNFFNNNNNVNVNINYNTNIINNNSNNNIKDLSSNNQDHSDNQNLKFSSEINNNLFLEGNLAFTKNSNSFTKKLNKNNIKTLESETIKKDVYTERSPKIQNYINLENKNNSILDLNYNLNNVSNSILQTKEISLNNEEGNFIFDYNLLRLKTNGDNNSQISKFEITSSKSARSNKRSNVSNPIVKDKNFNINLRKNFNYADKNSEFVNINKKINKERNSSNKLINTNYNMLSINLDRISNCSVESLNESSSESYNSFNYPILNTNNNEIVLSKHKKPKRSKSKFFPNIVKRNKSMRNVRGTNLIYKKFYENILEGEINKFSKCNLLAFKETNNKLYFNEKEKIKAKKNENEIYLTNQSIKNSGIELKKLNSKRNIRNYYFNNYKTITEYQNCQETEKEKIDFDKIKNSDIQFLNIKKSKISPSLRIFNEDELEIQISADFFIGKTEIDKFVTNINLNKLKYKSNNNINDINKKIIRILIVDDEKLIRQSSMNVLKKYLNKKKILYEIEECTDGIDCLSKVYQGFTKGITYDIIITDETMNFLNGSYMAKIIKNLVRENILNDIKIFMVTSYEWEIMYKKYSDILDMVFTKPLSMDIIDNIFNTI